MSRNRYFRGLLGFIAVALVVALAACTSATPAATPTPSGKTPAGPTATAAPAGKAITISLTAQNMAFDKNTITVSAGASVTIDFNNKDTGISHNFALYTDSTATKSIFVGQIIMGPATTQYKFTAPTMPGTYFFRCDVHPTQMTGSFVVTS